MTKEVVKTCSHVRDYSTGDMSTILRQDYKPMLNKISIKNESFDEGEITDILK